MNVTARKRTNSILRFQKYIELDILSGCWLWKGCITKKGYGLFKFNNVSLGAHRFSYQYWNGDIPKQLQIDHLCRTRNCVNPEHLEVISIKENIRRGISYNQELTYCKNGHKFTKENTMIRLTGGRMCRSCHNYNSAKSRIKIKIRGSVRN